MDDFQTLLRSEFCPYGILTSKQLMLLERHYLLLLRWNARMNLTRITNLGDAVRYHYCESLYLAEKLPKKPLRIADIGSGGGFPGIPVAIYKPDSTVYLVESNQRKAVFLREATVDFPNVTVVAERGDQVELPFCDWVVSRAVRSDDVLKATSAPNAALLGSEGELLPWGNARCLLLRSVTPMEQ